MAKCNLESDSDDIPTTSSHNTVFIDTTLDTHLAMIVSDTDTVSDLKKKIMSEHPQCFPSFGEIKIRSLKVKRKRYFYHLSDSMLVKSAFEGTKKSWFLSVDASSLQQCGDNQLSTNPDDSKQLALVCITKTPSDDRNNHLPESPLKRFSLLDTSMLPQPGDIQYTNQNFLGADRSGPGYSCKEVAKELEMEVRHVDDSCKKADTDFEMEKYDLLIKGNKIPQTNIEHRDGNFEAGLEYFHGKTSAEESLRTGPASKTKYSSKKKNDDAVSNSIVEDNNDSMDASGMHTSHLVVVHPEFSSGSPGKEVLNEMGMVNMDVGTEPCNTSFPDTNVRSDSGGIPGTHVECKKGKSLNMSGDAHQNESLVEASKSRPAEKKKRKRESKGPGNSSEEHKTLLSNFGEETPKAMAIIPEDSKENKLKPTTATSDSLFIQPPEDVQLVASSSVGKKKRKMKNKLPRDQVLAAERSLHDAGDESFKENGEFVANDSDEASVAAIVSEQNVQHATLSGTFEVPQKQKHPEPVQEVVERIKLPSSLSGIDASGPDTANEKVISNAPEPGAGSGSKRRRKSKKHHSTNVKEFTLSALNEFNNLKRDVTNSEHGNIVPRDQKIESSHPDKIAEQRELRQTRDSEAMLSDNCEPLIQGDADVYSKEAVVSDNLLETNQVIESGKSAGRRVKTRAKKSVATKQLMSSIEHADNSESVISSFSPHFNDHSSIVARKEESIFSQTKRTKISTPETVDTTLNGANGETDEMSGNEAESLPFNQVNKTQEKAENIDGNLGKKEKKNRTSDAKSFASFPVKEQANEVESYQLNQINMTSKKTENMDEKSRKKTKKNQNSAAKSIQPINEQEVGGEEASSNDRLRHVDKPSKTKMKTKLIKTSSKNHLIGRHPRQALTVNSAHVPSSDTLEGNSIGGPLQCDVDGCNIADANYQAGLSKCDDDRVNFKDHFVPEEHKHEVAPIELVVDKVSDAKRSDRDVKSKKNAKKLLVPSSATSPGLQNPLRSYVNQASKRRSHGVKAADSQDAEHTQTIPQESKHTDVVNSLKAHCSVHAYPEENGESLGPTNPGSDNCDKNIQTEKETKRQSSLGRHHVTVSKASNKKIGEVVNSSRHGKSLLATPGAIFRDGSTESSEDESGDVNSDSSTKAPSVNSSSSGYAEVESKSSLELPRNGIYGAKDKDGGESIIKSRSSGPKNITMDMILRGSSRFKKAKLTAAQSQLEDTESQPVDFVPDSQANL